MNFTPFLRTLSADMRQWPFFFNHPHDVDDSLNSCSSTYRCKMGEFAKQNRFITQLVSRRRYWYSEAYVCARYEIKQTENSMIKFEFFDDQTFARVYYYMCFAQEEIFNRNALIFQQNKLLWSLVYIYFVEFPLVFVLQEICFLSDCE